MNYRAASPKFRQAFRCSTYKLVIFHVSLKMANCPLFYNYFLSWHVLYKYFLQAFVVVVYRVISNVILVPLLSFRSEYHRYVFLYL